MTTLIESKHALKSTGAWGGLIIVIPVAMQILENIFGIAFSEVERAEVASVPAILENVWAQVMVLVGTVQMVIGRANARQPVHFSQKFYVDAETGRKVTDPKLIPIDLAHAIEERPRPA